MRRSPEWIPEPIIESPGDPDKEGRRLMCDEMTIQIECAVQVIIGWERKACGDGDQNSGRG